MQYASNVKQTFLLQISLENHDPQSSGTNYLQAVYKISTSKSPTLSITVQGKSATEDLFKLKPTQPHTISYVKNEIPHMLIILDEDVKNYEI
ncbi:hypothetical protein E2562_035571 [Oryza meyeriana var. granulata]|uniref:Uncharacterized protein n=1 Tax=Oryza meyeriana var. granulata TaxID=110450 RepID=A0A6G1ESM3_9ORYZ|nr:hypothetical protein E2562_035571 [Oryza meyeriana var. granulata]